MPICNICGEEKSLEEMFTDGVCSDCASSILWIDDIPPNVEDFY